MERTKRRRSREDFEGKAIDCHTHVGISLKAYMRGEYPYAQSLEDLLVRLDHFGVDAAVAFPYASDLYFDLHALRTGDARPAAQPLSAFPFQVENSMLLREVYEFFPEATGRFVPFAMVDPGRRAKEQVAFLRDTHDEWPVYGLKVSPVLSQVEVTELLGAGAEILQYAAEEDLPVLLHTTVDPSETYSHAEKAFRVVRKHPELRFCLAHCIGFHRGYLDEADAMPNVWVDTSALTIQVELTYADHPIGAPTADRVDADFSDHTAVMRALTDRYPDTILWGSDSPCYTYVSRRRGGDGTVQEFAARARYGDEKDALDRLSSALREKACSTNTIQFIFGSRV
jgi:predicted TIM-barrel fold metal-dependent hydrolase